MRSILVLGVTISVIFGEISFADNFSTTVRIGKPQTLKRQWLDFFETYYSGGERSESFPSGMQNRINPVFNLETCSLTDLKDPRVETVISRLVKKSLDIPVQEFKSYAVVEPLKLKGTDETYYRLQMPCGKNEEGDVFLMTCYSRSPIDQNVLSGILGEEISITPEK